MRRTFAAPLATLALLSACADDSSAPLDPTTTRLSAKKDTPATQASVTVVMSNLDNPRGLAWGPEGALYVAEAGNATNSGPCAPAPRGQNCYSGTGAITRLWKGTQERVATGLPSHILVTPTGPGDVTGPHDIAFQGKGNAYVTIGWAGPPAARAALGALGGWFAAMIRVTPNGSWDLVADIGGFEQAANPAGGPLDSNPYGILAEPGRQFLTDAGGNSVLEVTANGTVSLVSTLPPTPMGSEPVPTEVVRGPDGALYVSQLTGVPFTAGAASIWRLVPGGAPEIYKTGFKTITDFDWGEDGNIYLVEFASSPMFFGGPGRLLRVPPSGASEVLNASLTNPTGVLVGPDGAIYVSNRGNQAGTGEVLRIVP